MQGAPALEPRDTAPPHNAHGSAPPPTSAGGRGANVHGGGRGRGRNSWYGDSLSFQKLLATHLQSLYGNEIHEVVCHTCEDVHFCEGRLCVVVMDLAKAQEIIAEYEAIKKKSPQMGAYFIMS